MAAVHTRADRRRVWTAFDEPPLPGRGRRVA
jgi:hypothetical protein